MRLWLTTFALALCAAANAQRSAVDEAAFARPPAGCVAVAGLYGAATASRRILFIQTVPAAAGLALIALS